MAKAKSLIFSKLSGTIGGTNFAPLTNGHILVRRKPISRRPITTAQTKVRSAWSGAVQLWKDLNIDDQAGWNIYSQSLSHTGNIGTIHPTGRNVFLANISFALYMNSLFGNVTISTDPPLIPGVLEITRIHRVPAQAGPHGLSIQTVNPNPFDIRTFSILSRAYPRTRNFPPSIYLERFAIFRDVNPFSSNFSNYINLQGGTRYFIKARAISRIAPFKLSPLIFLRSNVP